MVVSTKAFDRHDGLSRHWKWFYDVVQLAGSESASDSSQLSVRAASYNEQLNSVAPKVALGSPENACDVVTLPDDLGEVVRLWAGLSEDVRKAVDRNRSLTELTTPKRSICFLFRESCCGVGEHAELIGPGSELCFTCLACRLRMCPRRLTERHPLGLSVGQSHRQGF